MPTVAGESPIGIISQQSSAIDQLCTLATQVKSLGMIRRDPIEAKR